jgi:hypothetical protein
MLCLAAERLRHHPRVGRLGRVAGDAAGDEFALRGQGAQRFDAAVELVPAEIAAAGTGKQESGGEDRRRRARRVI